MHAKKITKLYTMAMKIGAPVIGLVDCAGLRLQEATDALNGFGEIYISQTLASGVVPQIMAIFGLVEAVWLFQQLCQISRLWKKSLQSCSSIPLMPFTTTIQKSQYCFSRFSEQGSRSGGFYR